MTDELRMELEQNYFDGMEDGVMMVRRILELDMSERKKHFGDYDVSVILDKFDFQQLHEILSKPELKPDKELKKYYIIRGIKTSIGNKKAIAESGRLYIEPTDEMIEAFLLNHSEADFAVTETIYTRE
jgi:hypothetical protein